ncbi:hypothetical protein D9M68_587720 [compost metagenome]
MAAAMDLRLQPDARLAAHVQRADPFRPVDLVRGHGQQVDLQCRQVDRDLARGLHRVAVEHDARRAADLADLRDRLDHADLVVDHHHRHQDGVRPQRRAQDIEVDQAVRSHIEIRHVEALPLQFAAGIEHGLVLGLDRDDVIALAAVEMRRALDREVVAFGGAGGPDDLAQVGIEQRRNLRARRFHGRFRLPAVAVAARGRVAELLVQERHHLVDDAEIHRRRRAVVHVDGEVVLLVLHGAHSWLRRE